MKRTASIEALLKKARLTFDDLKRAYESSLQEKTIREDLKVDIKNIFENLRSCLTTSRTRWSNNCARQRQTVFISRYAIRN
jgi:hypothetical protein